MSPLPLVLLCLVAVNIRVQAAAPVVQTTLGPVQGFSALSDTVDVFLGIPFAQPPVGQLRFERTLPPKPWTKVLNATAMPKGCYPHALALNDSTAESMSEDCLYLNIYAPRPPKGSLGKKFPVVVAIHGGAFELGSAALFANYTDIGNSFVKHGIVFVVIQYRLGELGFASTGDTELPGNNGLWDQRMALRFVRQNIARFGGDPRRVTAMGQSAGASSASALSLSPHTRDLFDRVIAMSGSALVSWVYGSRVVEDTLELVSLLNCSLATSAATKSCLKRVPVRQMLQTLLDNNPSRPGLNGFKFVPRFDGDFFPAEPLELIKWAPKKPTIQGFTQLESLVMTYFFGVNTSTIMTTLPFSAIDTYNSAELREYINQYVANTERFGEAAEEVAERIHAFYVNGGAVSEFARSTYNGSAFYIRQYTELASDALLVMASVLEIKRKVDAGWPVHMYISNYSNPSTFPPQVPFHECFHSVDFAFVFDSLGSTYSPEDNVMRDFYREAFRNFIKTGNASTTDASTPLQWPVVPHSSHLRHVHVHAPLPRLADNATDALNKLAFWGQLHADFPQYDVIREIAGAKSDGNDCEE